MIKCTSFVKENHLQVVTVDVVVIKVDAATMYSLLEKEFSEIYP
jgi:hypothetical protein